MSRGSGTLAQRARGSFAATDCRLARTAKSGTRASRHRGSASNSNGGSFCGYGECLPREENRCTLDRSTVDAWGIPALHIDASWSPNELALLADMRAAAVEILEAVGATGIQPGEHASVMGGANHEMGTARMGRDARTSVLDGYNRAHDIPNLYVTDGSCMTSSGWQNPSLTYMALTARACHHAVDALARREI
jgi:choline dehydrogenase-like flavoprotein